VPDEPFTTPLPLFKPFVSMAERAGFEPAVHLCGHTHDFQSCSFSRSDISPVIAILFNHRDVTYHVSKSISGGERGIRTPVGACGPQIDFESIPLRPLRYLSAYFIRLSIIRFLISFLPSLVFRYSSRLAASSFVL
jgi:hypothetical protein